MLICFYSIMPGILYAICDLLREKGPTAVKRRFKTQLTAFCRKMLCKIFTSASQLQLNAFHSRKEKKKKKTWLTSFS